MTGGPGWTLFDLDGCLVDSSRAIPACINVALDDLGLPPRSPADLQWCIGPPLADSFARLLSEAGDAPGPARVEAALVAYREVFPELAGRLTTVVDGIPDLLDGLVQRRAVVTSKPVSAAAPLVHHLGLGGYVEDVFGPGDEIEGEPKADTLARALGALGIGDVRRAVMIGDRHHDVDAGRANGTSTVGVTWGAGHRDELAGAGPDHLVDSPSELAQLLSTIDH